MYFDDKATQLSMIGQVKVASGMGVAHQLHRGSSHEGVMLRAKESRHDCIMVWYAHSKPPTQQSMVDANCFVMVLSRLQSMHFR